MRNKIYIGDNLKLMNDKIFDQYIEKIKMIYIDPPYNTQTKKSYNDNISSKEWNMFLKKRLEVSKKFLRKDGVIFISIDDNEYANLKLLCDDVFGIENFIGTFITQQAQRSNAKYINVVHEYILCYARNKTKLHKFEINRMDIPEDRKMINTISRKVKAILRKDGLESANKKLKNLIDKYCLENNITWLKNYSNIDENGEVYFAVDLSVPGEPREVNIPDINLKLAPLPTRSWASDKKFIELYNENRLCFKGKRPYEKHYLYEAKDNVPSILNFFSRQGTNDLKKLGIGDLFDTPKPVEMLKFLIRIGTKNKNDIVLDYFAGSGTLAQAVYEINKEDNKNISYILIQIAEPINKKSKVYNICKDIGINQSIDAILKLRIERYLELNNMEKDFEYIRFDK